MAEYEWVFVRRENLWELILITVQIIVTTNPLEGYLEGHISSSMNAKSVELAIVINVETGVQTVHQKIKKRLERFGLNKFW